MVTDVLRLDLLYHIFFCYLKVSFFIAACNIIFVYPLLRPHFFTVKNLFKPLNITLYFKVQHTTHRFFCNSKDPTPSLHRSGVYELSCCTPHCNALYVGQKGRKLATRVQKRVIEADKFENNPSLDASFIKSDFARHLHLTQQGFKALY